MLHDDRPGVDAPGPSFDFEEAFRAEFEERWAEIAGHAGYEISTHGRVRSTARVAIQRSRWGGTRRVRIAGTVLSAAPDSDGYPLVCLGRGKPRRVHVLVAEEFCERPPDHDPSIPLEACHKDGDRMNPRADNLYWGTRSQNGQDRWRHWRERRDG